MGWPILGEDDTVAAFTREHLRKYMQTNYLAGGMTLIASGAVKHADIVRLAEDKFSAVRAGTTPEPAPARWIGGDMRLDDSLEQAHMTFAFPGLSQTDPGAYAAQVYVTALGGGMSSRLFQEVREKRGLCYSIYAFAHSANDSASSASIPAPAKPRPARLRRSWRARWRRWPKAPPRAEVARA